ncbi:MAG: polysaccharide pyruvyl transferase family protein [Acutalibacteraceae bacterium]
MAYKIFYPIIPNMGDLLNKDMIEDVFNIQVEQASLKTCNIIAIGSTLDHTMYSTDTIQKLKQKIAYFGNKGVHIWGTGFIRGNPEKDTQFVYKNVEIHAVRGELSKKRVEKVLGKKLDIPTGDGGLLVERWVGYYPEKKYKVGIIPHFKEQEHPSVKKLLEGYEDTTLINLREDPKTVCEKIGECEYIISSSLHGMIVADSFHIPNIHITLNNGMFGDGNKFADYLSGFGVEHIPFDCEKGDIPSLQLVKDNYKISIEQVEQKKQQLFDAFPRL